MTQHVKVLRMFALGVRVFISLGVMLGGICYYYYHQREREQKNIRHETTPCRIIDCAVCTICLEEFDMPSSVHDIVLPCSHKFHKECIFNVFRNEIRNNKLCPVCRRRISEDFIKTTFYQL